MCHSRAFRLFAFCLVAGAAIIYYFASSRPVEPSAKTAPEGSMYQTDPEHLWNRLHEAMLVRIGPDGRAYGQDRLEPLLWLGSKHLLDEQSNKRVVALLEEFLRNKGEKLVEDPLKRAVLQRDLWLVFNWLEGDHRHFYEPALESKDVQAARDRLRGPAGGRYRPVGPHSGSNREAAGQLCGGRRLGRLSQEVRPGAPGQILSTC